MPKKQPVVVPGQESQGRPYSLGLTVGDFVFVAGQGPLDPVTKEIKGSTIEEQTEVVMQNIRSVLTAAGCSMNDCVKATVHLLDMNHWERFNAVYTKFFQPPYPVRTTVQSKLWHDILVEVDVIAVKGAGGK